MVGDKSLSTRLYLPISEMGCGLMDARIEYGKEIIRTILHYRWRGNQQLRALIRSDPLQEEKLLGRGIRAIAKGEEATRLDEYIEDTDKNKENIRNVMKYIDRLVKERRIEEWKMKGSSATFRRAFENQFTDRVIINKVWKEINIRPSMFRVVVQMQNGEIVTGQKKAAITKVEEDKYCKFCKGEVASINHILLCCKITKKKQIEKHDMVAEEIWKEIFKHERIKEPYNKEFIETEEVLMLFNKEYVRRSAGKFPKRPDITYIKKKDKIFYHIDPTIVSDERMEEAYRKKLQTYEELNKFLIKEKEAAKAITIPVVITVNGLLHKFSRKRLEELGITINWKQLIRTIIIRNAQDILAHIHNQPSSTDEANQDDEWDELNSEGEVLEISCNGTQECIHEKMISQM